MCKNVAQRVGKIEIQRANLPDVELTLATQSNSNMNNNISNRVNNNSNDNSNNSENTALPSFS